MLALCNLERARVMNDIRAGLVPKTTKSKVMLTKYLTKYRFLGIIAVFFSSMVIGMAFGSLRYVFVVFCLVIFMICTAGSPSDPRKSFGGSLLDFLRFFAQKKHTTAQEMWIVLII